MRTLLAVLLLLAWPDNVRAAPEDFPEYPELRRDVEFWVRVYSEITTEQGFLHDEQNLAVVYDVVAVPPDLSGSARQRLIDSARDGHVARLRSLAARWRVADSVARQRALRVPRGLAPASPREALATLGYDPEAIGVASGQLPGVATPLTQTPPPGLQLSPEEQRLVDLFGAEVGAERLQEAARRVRFQLGQADRFRAGIVRSGAWERHIAATFAAQGLPAELAALPHVESSFNPAAWSKVGAVGLWQFMRSTGRLYMRVDDELDERMDPFRATEAAAQLLAYNHRLLGSWPLAITAYNHGAAGMRRARDTMGTTNMAVIARNYKARTFGFASRNFYPSFLAVLRIDREPQRYFPGVRLAVEQQNDTVELPAWVPVAAIEAATGVDRAALRALNPAVRDPIWNGERYLPRGYKLHLPRAASGPTWSQERLLAALPPGQLFAGQYRSRSHVVRQGETLARVARKHGLTTAELARLNGLSRSASLRRGTVLRLPESSPAQWQSPAPANVAAANVTPSEADTGGTELAAPSPEPSLVPLDRQRYAVADDGAIRALGGETLGQLAEWLALPLARLAELNPEHSGTLPLGTPLRLDFGGVPRAEFQQRREQWHAQRQAEYFETRRIVGSTTYMVEPGDSLWTLLEKFGGVPSWLLEQYNPQVDLLNLRAGERLVVPRIAP